MVPTGLALFAAHGLSFPKIPVCYDGKWDATFAHFTVWNEGLEKQVLLRIYVILLIYFIQPQRSCVVTLFLSVTLNVNLSP